MSDAPVPQGYTVHQDKPQPHQSLASDRATNTPQHSSQEIQETVYPPPEPPFEVGIMAEVTRSSTSIRYTIAPLRFHALFHSLFRVLFNFPLRYLSSIGISVRYLALEGIYLPYSVCNPKQTYSSDMEARTFPWTWKSLGISPTMSVDPRFRSSTYPNPQINGRCSTPLRHNSNPVLPGRFSVSFSLFTRRY